MKQDWQKKVTSSYAGVAFQSIIPVSIFAMAFSPDGKFLAFGAGFIEYERVQSLKTPQGVKYTDYARSYKAEILVVSSNQPDIVTRRFEISLPPWLNRPELIWSPDGKFIAVNYQEYEYDHAFLLKLDTAEQYVIHKNLCGLAGILVGPLVVLECRDVKLAKTNVRFLAADQSVQRDFDFPGLSFLLAIEADKGTLAMRFPDSVHKNQQHPDWSTHQIAIFDSQSRTEVQRWFLPEAILYAGAFADSGKLFCAAPWTDVRTARELVCRNISTGTEIARIPVHWGGGMSEIKVGGTRIAFEEDSVHFVPKPFVRPLDTEFVIGERSAIVWDFQSGRKLAQWKIRNQKVLPHKEREYSHALSPDGKNVAIGGAGVITMYQAGSK